MLCYRSQKHAVVGLQLLELSSLWISDTQQSSTLRNSSGSSVRCGKHTNSQIFSTCCTVYTLTFTCVSLFVTAQLQTNTSLGEHSVQTRLINIFQEWKHLSLTDNLTHWQTIALRGDQGESSSANNNRRLFVQRQWSSLCFYTTR